MNLLRHLLSGFALVAGTFLLSVGLQAIAAWTPPSSSPPSSNAYAPLNTGPDAQTKTGNLIVNGNIGIGVASPLQKLEIAGQVKITGGIPGAGKVLTSDASGLASWMTPGGGVTSVATNNGLTGGTIITSGTLGLNLTGISSCTNSTSNKIYWNGSYLACGTDQTGVTSITGAGGFTPLTGDVKISGGGALSVAVNTTTKTITLDLAPPIRWAFSGNTITTPLLSPNLDVMGNLSVSGNATAASYTTRSSQADCPGGWFCNVHVWDISASGVYYSTALQRSDARLKTDVAPLTVSLNSLDAVKNLQGVSYRWKEGTGDSGAGIHYGFIAQDVEKVLPDLVHTTQEGMKSVETEGIIPVLTEALKEQQKEIDLLKTENETLTGRIKALESR